MRQLSLGHIFAVMSSFPIVEVESVASGQKGLWFHRFQVGQLLGIGAFGEVFEAKDIRTNEDVAIKVIRKDQLIADGSTEIIKREISAMRRLRHPNIVRLYHVLATKTKIYFVMELVRGGSLVTEQSKGRVTEDFTRRYFQQLISAVRYCHIRGVFHRDLKPQNLLLNHARELKVSDFGLSAIRKQGEADRMLITFCGSPSFVAPEVISRKGYNGATADVWSCGVILFALKAGYLPFSDANLNRLCIKICSGEFNLPRRTSPGLKHLISRLLDPNAETRINLDEILKDPWFIHNPYENVNFNSEDYDAREFDKTGDTSEPINAFDIISSSSSLNLSGLFGNAITPDQSDRMISTEKPGTIMDRVEEVAKDLNLRISMKKEWAVRLEGEQKHLIVEVKFHRLTGDLIMVDVRNKGRDLGSPWAASVRTKLSDLIQKPGDRAYLNYHVASS